MRIRFLPWEYGVRNLFRKPIRSLLTVLSITIAVLLILISAGFERGLSRSLQISGNPNTVLVYSLTAAEMIENSVIESVCSSLLLANIGDIEKQNEIACVSPEICLGTEIQVITDETDDRTSDQKSLGIVRGITRTAPLVRTNIRLLSGRWPQEGEVMVGKLAATKLGYDTDQLRVGRLLEFENRQWKVSGTFASDGSIYESEIWGRLEDFQISMKRNNLSLVAIRLNESDSSSEVDLLCKERRDLEIQATTEAKYYERLIVHYQTVRTLIWSVCALIAAAGVFAGMNTMYSSISGRIRELATLQSIGHPRIAIMTSVIQEGLLLASTGTIAACTLAIFFVHGIAVRFTMGAFAIQIDHQTVLLGCLAGLSMGLFGSIIPAYTAIRQPIVVALRSVQ